MRCCAVSPLSSSLKKKLVAGEPLCGFRSLFLGILFVSVISAPAQGEGTTTPIALTGTPIPNGAGEFIRFGVPVINDDGRVAFRANVLEDGRKVDVVYIGSGKSLTEVVRGNQRAPDGNGRFEYFSTPLFNNSGDVAFWIGLIETRGIEQSSDDEGVFLSRGGRVTQIVREGQAAPHGRGTVEGFLSYDFNTAGIVSFLLATKKDRRTEWAVYLGRGEALTQITAEGASAPDDFGRFSRFGAPSLNDAGEVVFSAVTTSAVRTRGTHTGVYKSRGGLLTTIARVGETAPDGNGRFAGFTEPMINGVGQVTFRAQLSGTRGGARDDVGVFRDDGGNLTQVVRAGQPVPGGNGVFADFKAPVLNDSGTVTFAAFLSGARGGVAEDSGIFSGTGGAVTHIAREGQRTPDGASIFSELNPPALNDAGVLAFGAVLVPAEGRGATRRSIYLANGRDLFPVVRTGDAVAGSTITAVHFRGRSNAGWRGLNAVGQIAYQAALADGRAGVFLYTPTLHWRHRDGGEWNRASNWTLGLAPDDVHETYVDPPRDLTVAGPAARAEVKRLVIGGGAGTATLRLDGGTIRSHDPVEIAATGALTGVGVIDGDLHNNGVVSAEDITVSGNLHNKAYVQGSGRLHARLVNTADGEVRVRGGEKLRFSETENTNSGRIEINGGELSFTHELANETDGRIDIQDNAILKVEGGLTNVGTLRLRGADSQLVGALVNDGNILIAEGARVTFHDPVTNNAEIHLGAGTQAVFRAHLSGAGVFSGFGSTSIEGRFSPGGGVSRVTIAGDLDLGYDNVTTVELGGTLPGTGHDAIDLDGTLALGGILDVRLIPDAEGATKFMPGAGDMFVLFRATHIAGNFRQTKLPMLRKDLRWGIQQTATEYVLSVQTAPR